MRVLVLERNRATCEAIAQGLSEEGGIDAHRTAFSVPEALRALNESTSDVDVVVTTLSLGEEAVLELARTLRDRVSAPDLVVAGLPSSDSVIVEYLLAGVDAYLTEEVSIRGLAVVVRLLGREEVLVAPSVMRRLIQTVHGQARLLDHNGLDVTRVAGLTAREREVLDLLGEGASNRQIARRLFIEPTTVKSHVHAILKKLRVGRRSDAQRLWILQRNLARADHQANPSDFPSSP